MAEKRQRFLLYFKNQIMPTLTKVGLKYFFRFFIAGFNQSEKQYFFLLINILNIKIPDTNQRLLSRFRSTEFYPQFKLTISFNYLFLLNCG